MRRIPFILVGVVALVACVPKAPPVATLLVSPASLTLRYSEARVIDMEFAVETALEDASSLRVFVHLIDEPGNVLRTFDHAFPGEWAPGNRVHHRLRIHQSALGPPLRAGRYMLSIGIYDAQGRRWPLEAEGEEIDDMEYAVMEIAVSEPSASPRFRFSEAWKPIEAGVDRQILGRRWLVDEGSIWITEAGEVESVWMVVHLPNAEAGVSHLTLAEGAEEQGLVLSSACGSAVVEILGAGPHEVEVPVRGSEAGERGECEITLEPNFHVAQNESPERRTVLLEALAWSPGEDL